MLSPLRRRGKGFQKIAEKIRYLRRDAFDVFVDEPFQTFCDADYPAEFNIEKYKPQLQISRFQN